MSKKMTRARARKRDRKGRFARVLLTLKGTAIAALVYGVFVGGLVAYKKIHETETYSLTATPVEAAVFPIGELAPYDPCGLDAVVCEGEPANELEKLITDTFGADARTALAVAKAESGLDERAMGWNCRYPEGKNKDGSTRMVSRACKPEDRGKAWSVDCGIFQVNHLGQACPKELFDIRHNVELAKDIYDRGGWDRWVAYTTGKHKKYLKER